MAWSRIAWLPLAGLLIAPPLAAQNAIKPGLWEVRNTLQSGNGQLEKAMAQMQQKMASMPPEQRKMMQDMMAKQGVTLGGPGASTSVKTCITPEMASRQSLPLSEQGCTQTVVSHTASVTELRFSCKTPPSTGTGRFTFSSPERYTGEVQTQSTVQGSTQTMRIHSTGQWLSSQCDGVAPVR